jgi:hypothetical protein
MRNDDLSRATWRRSSYSGNSGNCVEIAIAKSVVRVRDSKNRNGGVLYVGIRDWNEFLCALK